mmetsp:Transcript_19939/g.47518  ORF Transcript_19939/g.47518 Transcript_19939/m.47518 type:complete len:228 (-) Transcript_19939:2442-3125(-)
MWTGSLSRCRRRPSAGWTRAAKSAARAATPTCASSRKLSSPPSSMPSRRSTTISSPASSTARGATLRRKLLPPGGRQRSAPLPRIPRQRRCPREPPRQRQRQEMLPTARDWFSGSSRSRFRPSSLRFAPLPFDGPKKCLCTCVIKRPPSPSEVVLSCRVQQEGNDQTLRKGDESPASGQPPDSDWESDRLPTVTGAICKRLCGFLWMDEWIESTHGRSLRAALKHPF